MFGAIEGIERAVHGKTLDDYRKDWLLKHAVQRGIEIISEASRRLPEAAVMTRPDIPWRRVRGIGNILRHEYNSLSDVVIWGVVVDELPRLRDALEAIRDAAPPD